MLKYEREVAYFSQGLGISSGQGARLPSDEINAEYNQLMKLLSANGKDQDWWTSQGYGDRTRKFIELRDGNRLSALENVWNKRKQGSEGLGIQGIFEDAEGAKVSRFGERIYTDDDLALPEGTQGPEQKMDRDTLAKRIGEKLKTNFEKFRDCLLTFSIKDFDVLHGPTISLNNIIQKRVKRRNIKQKSTRKN